MIDKSTIESLRDRLPDYVNSKLTKEGKQYVCPCCGKVHLNVYTEKGEWKWKCFYGSCQNQGDLFDLVGYIENIPNDASTFPQRVRIAAESLGVHISGLTDTATSTPARARKNKQNLPSRQNTNKPLNINNKMGTTDENIANGKEMEAKIRAVIEQSRKRLADPTARKKYPEAVAYLEERGISLETAIRAGVGYDPKWRSPKPTAKNAPFTRRIIFPYHNGNTYRTRCIDPLPEKQKNYKKMAAKPTEDSKLGVFFAWASDANKDNDILAETAEKHMPLFILEGEFDALSIAETGHNAVALGGTGGMEMFLSILRDAKKIPPLILALDHDTAGETAQQNLAAALTNLGLKRGQPIEFISEDFMKLCGREREGGSIPKDANEMLVLDRNALEKGIALSVRLLDDPNYLYDREHLAIHILEGLSTQGRVQLAPTGFAELDKALDGGLFPGLYILGAIPSLGKSTLALQIADNIAASGKDVLFVSLEMSKFELIAKILSRLSYTAVLEAGQNPDEAASTTRDIMRQVMLGEEAEESKGTYLFKAFKAHKESVAARHLAIHESNGDCGADQIRNIALDHRARKGQNPVIFVDYLQILAPKKEERPSTDKMNMDYSVKILKQLSRDMNTPVFAISSLNRDGYSKAVSFESFKESGAVEYGCDVLMGMQLKIMTGTETTDPQKVLDAKRAPQREIELVILKNRNGALPDKNIPFYFYAKHNTFSETSEEEMNESWG